MRGWACFPFLMPRGSHPHPPCPWPAKDDFWVRLTCGGDGRVVVESQGELRLGVGDWGVNPARNTALAGSLRRAALDGAMPKGRCHASGGDGAAGAGGGAGATAGDGRATAAVGGQEPLA